MDQGEHSRVEELDYSVARCWWCQAVRIYYLLSKFELI